MFFSVFDERDRSTDVLLWQTWCRWVLDNVEDSSLNKFSSTSRPRGCIWRNCTRIVKRGCGSIHGYASSDIHATSIHLSCYHFSRFCCSRQSSFYCLLKSPSLNICRPCPDLIHLHTQRACCYCLKKQVLHDDKSQDETGSGQSLSQWLPKGRRNGEEV